MKRAKYRPFRRAARAQLAPTNKKVLTRYAKCDII